MDFSPASIEYLLRQARTSEDQVNLAKYLSRTINERISGLLAYNSKQVILRRAYKAQVTIAEKALNRIEYHLADYMDDRIRRTGGNFKDFVDVDEARFVAQDALYDITRINPDDYGRP